jgi:SPASM domain peptide maturase of grasp-with-spasm system
MKKETVNNSFFSEFSLLSENHFKLFASCIPVKGTKRGAIFDLQRGNIHFVPNTLLELLEEYTDKRLFEEYIGQKDTLAKYFNYLYDNDLIFCTNEPLNFPNISTKKYFIPNSLDFLSLEIDTVEPFKVDMLQNIDKLGVRELIIVQNNIDIDNIVRVLKLCENSKVTGIVIVSPNSELIKTNKFVKIIESNLRVLKWIFYNTETSKDIHSKITFRKGSLKDILCKRIGSVNDFVINTTAYIEAVNHNLYFNRRAYTDNKGQVKHSFDDPLSYGSIQTKELHKIISTEKFQELWNVTKVHVKECRNCEFRFVCPDNRIPKKINNTEYEHTTTCQYNPHSSTWKNDDV